jgi:hypothetical protein
MTLEIFDIHPVNLDGTITTSGDLDLLHGRASITAHYDKLLNRLDALNVADVVVVDFVHDDDTHEAHVWDLDECGALAAKWGRDSNGSSRRFDEEASDVLVVAVPPGVSVPQQPAPSGPPAPGTVQKKVRVGVGKRVLLPLR